MPSLWTLAATLSFSLMAVFVKYAASHYSAHEILFYRSSISVALIGSFAAWRRYRVFTPHWRAHSRRAGCGTFSIGVWYYTLSVLPIATSVTLNSTSPIFIGVLSAVAAYRAGQRRAPNPMQYVSLAVGFAGVVILLNPSASSDHLWPGILGLFGAFMAALGNQDVKRLVLLGEPEWRLVFYFSLYSALLSFVIMLFSEMHSHTLTGVLLLLAVSIFGTLGQLAVSRAYGHGNVLLSASLQYSSVLFSACWGMALWGEYISLRGWAGISIVIAASIVSSALIPRQGK